MATSENERLEQLFSAALERESGADRTGFLDAACADDLDLRTRVETLLSMHGQVGSFLETPPVDPDATIESWEPSEATGTRIGRYKILQEIGEGGFGVVYMAEQEEPVRRKVALKIIKLGMDTKQVIARFEAERQALALMDHPNIAGVLDGGATTTGRPYFVMELVKGIAITAYCDKHKLSTRDRLELFQKVCQAVQHAHQKGIIHRDLKPNNVLVALHDSCPVPKVIDFGIAKATSQRLTDKTLFTEFRQFLGTPEYMSPDQAEVTALDVDTRTDIYSLGVMLYELLTGTTPFDAKTLREASYAEIQRIIREVEPPKPSARLQTLSTTQDCAAIAAVRRLDPVALPRFARGDLDWIVMKAMEKDRTRRYATAKDLADDVGRHLRHEPVLAGPPGATYKLRKFVRRHRVGVVAGSIVVVALVVAFALAAVGLVEANRARGVAELARGRAQEQRAAAESSADQARIEAEKSATVSLFLEDMLGSVDPSQARGREVTVRFILDEAARKIDEGVLAGQPEVEAAIRTTLGETYEALGLYADAEVQLRAAVTMRAGSPAGEPPAALRSDHALARVLRVTGKFVEAEALLRRTAETQRRTLGAEHPDTLATMTELALALWGPGRHAEAEPIHRQILEIQQRVLGEAHIDTLKSMGYLGAVCRALGKYGEAEALLLRALDGSRQVLGEEHPWTAELLNHVGLLREDQSDYEPAQALFQQAYELDRRILGDDHPQTLIPMNNLLRVLHIRDEVDEIRPLIAARLARLKRAADRPDANAGALHAYAWELLTCEPAELRDPAMALAVAQRADELDGGRDANILDTLALAFQMTGKIDEAIATQRRAVDQSRAGGPYNRAELESRLVQLMLAKGDVVGAASLSWEGLAQQFGESLITDPALGASLVLRAETAMNEKRYEDAASLLYGCLATRQKVLPEGHWLIADTVSQLGGAVAGQRRFAEAEPLLLSGYAGLRDDRHVSLDRKRQAVSRIIRLYQTWEKPEQVTEWRRRLEEMADDVVVGD